jgi:integrase
LLLKLLREAGRDLPGERMERWSSAFEDWLTERRTQFTPNVGEDSQQAWQEFLTFTGKAPWEATGEDVEAYVESLTARRLRPGTIAKRLTGISKFYRFCQETGVDPDCEASFNPAWKARHPKARTYEKANYLSKKEEASLLEAVRQDPSPMGKRDYALFLALLKTGRRAGEVRRLKWGEFKEDSSMPDAAREAVLDYLEAAGRSEGIQDEEYLFAPSRAPLVREARDRAQDWDGGRPLSVDELHYLLKRNSERAGLKAEKITCQTLRNTAAARSVEAGGTTAAVQTRLGRSSAAGTKKYLRRLAESRKGRLRARRRAEDGDQEVPSRGPCRAGPRNHLGLKHGLYAKYLPELDQLAEQRVGGRQLKELDREIFRLRAVMRRVLILTEQPESLKEAMRALEAGGTAAVRIAKAKLLKKNLRDLKLEVFIKKREEEEKE